jgi:twitching motility protein PilJ
MTLQSRQPLNRDPSLPPEDANGYDPSNRSSADASQTSSDDLQSPEVKHSATNSTPTLNTPVTRSSPLRWFYQLPIQRKMFLALLASQLLSIVGLVSVGSWLLLREGQTQSASKAKSELSILEAEYDDRTNQMQTTLRLRAEDNLVVAIAKEYDSTGSASPDDLERLRNVLRRSARTQKIEYLTLVDSKHEVIANANANRTGDRFDPDRLVERVLDSSEELAASAIVPWSELKAEAPPLPKGLSNQDALIEYVLVPVKDAAGQNVVGVLIAGALANSNVEPMSATIESFGQGYSGIYRYPSTGKAVLAASAAQKPGDPSTGQATELELNRPLLDSAILSAATKANGQVVTASTTENNHSYTLAAKALLNNDQKPVGVLVRATLEDGLSKLLHDSFLLQLLVGALVLVGSTALALRLARSIMRPVEELRRVQLGFAAGDRQVRARVFAEDEVGELAASFNELADGVVLSESMLKDQNQVQERAVEGERKLNRVITRMRSSLNRQDILNSTVQDIRVAMDVDRILVYMFDENWHGTIIAESVIQRFSSALGRTIIDPCFATDYINKYRQGRVQVTNNIYKAGLTACHLDQLEPLEVKANLVVPILEKSELIGLLIAHQCSAPRFWHPEEINFLRQMGFHLGYALEQADLYGQKEAARLQAESLSEEQRLQRESLQQQLLVLLTSIEGVSHGDLTVRAEVTSEEIGTVADFFNAIVENLREIVTNVKRSAVQVSTSLGDNEGAVNRLADEALQQANRTTEMLGSVEQMTRSIQDVAESAHKTAQVAQAASATAESGGVAMDLTVQHILSLRQTIGETAKKVKRLGESSQQIAKVVSLINQIALQTNLLAINAGIEAARAGEQGQGFGVVAEEIGELAARSSTATQEIEKIVENIQRETSHVVDAMEQSTTQVVEGTHLVESAKKSLNQILEVSYQIDQLVQSISQATVSQSDTSGAVSRLMQEVSQMSERTSKSSRQVSEAMRQTVEVAQELRASVEMFEVDHEAKF